jgi:hypothetical protein
MFCFFNKILYIHDYPTTRLAIIIYNYISSQRENKTYICSVGTLTRSSRLATNFDPGPSNAQLSHFYNFFPHKILVYLALIYNYNIIIDILFISLRQCTSIPTRLYYKLSGIIFISFFSYFSHVF